MKRIYSCLLTLFLLIFLCACSGNFAQIDLKQPIPISETGIIESHILKQIKNNNAIATFTGTSGELDYEWTIFGSDISDTRAINLLLHLEQTKDGISIHFEESQDFGFPALLSIYLNDKWTAQSATVYADNSPVYSVSITGSKTSILNISVNKIVKNCIIQADTSLVAEYSSENFNTELVENKMEHTIQNKAESIFVDEYLSSVAQENTNISSDNNTSQEDNRNYSDGNKKEKDNYLTDPVPEGKPMPVEPQDQEVDKKKTYTCTVSIECATILNNLKNLDANKRELVPSNGVILSPTKVTFYEGESVYDVLQRVCKENGIHMESSWTPIYNSAYVEGIQNLYEFDCGELSGWMYRVNGWYPNYGCSRYQLVQDEVIEWRYTCDLGKDIGCDWMQ